MHKDLRQGLDGPNGENSAKEELTRLREQVREAIRQQPAMKFITINEFCALYRISPRTVWNWVRKGRLKALRDSGGRVFRLVDPEWPVLDDSRDPNPTMRFGALKTGHVAALLGVRPDAVRKMVLRGRLKAMRIGTQRRFSLAEVRRAIAARALGHFPKNSKETDRGVVKWARWRLGLKDEDPAI